MSYVYYKRPKPEGPGRYVGFDHITFWVGNAKQAASFYCTRMGFEPFAYQGLETGERDVVSHAVRQNKIIFVFKSPLNPGHEVMAAHQSLHGDGVKDVAFSVEDCRSLYKKAIARGATGVREPWEEKDESGTVILATIQTYGDTIHTLVERTNYTGIFLPGYKKPLYTDPLTQHLPPGLLDFIDHVAGNQEPDEMKPVTDWYIKTLEFHQFWSIDDSLMSTVSKFSATHYITVANWHETIKMIINEPAPARRPSSVPFTFLRHYGSPGVQHIALSTSNIRESIANLRYRGMEFLSIPDKYYDSLRERLKTAKITVREDISELQHLNILVDYDDNGYLLQIFTKPMQDRPTLFLEVIERHNHCGFGAGNFEALFEAIEAEMIENVIFTDTQNGEEA